MFDNVSHYDPIMLCNPLFVIVDDFLLFTYQSTKPIRSNPQSNQFNNNLVFKYCDSFNFLVIIDNYTINNANIAHLP